MHDHHREQERPTQGSGPHGASERAEKEQHRARVAAVAATVLAAHAEAIDRLGD